MLYDIHTVCVRATVERYCTTKILYVCWVQLVERYCMTYILYVWVAIVLSTSTREQVQLVS